MKVLFITDAKGPDYMSDMIFHGGKSILSSNFYETTKMSYMYDDIKDKENLYGRGFTMYGKISSELYNSLPSTPVELIQNKFFDKIIYGSIWRCSSYFDIVSKIYDKKNIIFIDGEDEMDRLNNFFINKGTYFKREYGEKVNGVYPINFGIPEELIIDNISEKTKFISDIIPNYEKKYSFDNETDYYREYSLSWYATTKKKGGWDCLRHYEIMMNGCIPLFENLENCPSNTLTFLPKKEIIKYNILKEMNLEWNYFILKYCKEKLTTKKIIEYILQ